MAPWEGSLAGSGDVAGDHRAAVCSGPSHTCAPGSGGWRALLLPRAPLSVCPAAPRQLS